MHAFGTFGFDHDCLWVQLLGCVGFIYAGFCVHPLGFMGSSVRVFDSCWVYILGFGGSSSRVFGCIY